MAVALTHSTVVGLSPKEVAQPTELSVGLFCRVFADHFRSRYQTTLVCRSTLSAHCTDAEYWPKSICRKATKAVAATTPCCNYGPCSSQLAFGACLRDQGTASSPSTPPKPMGSPPARLWPLYGANERSQAILSFSKRIQRRLALL